MTDGKEEEQEIMRIDMGGNIFRKEVGIWHAKTELSFVSEEWCKARVKDFDKINKLKI